MSGDSGERYIRLVHFLANGCTKLTRALVEKLVENSKPNDLEHAANSWSLDDFLYEHQRKLSSTKKDAMYKKLFPGRHKETNIEEWDICLLCFVVINCADDWLVRQDVKMLRSIRNKVIHGNTNIEKEQFDHFVNTIEVTVKRCCTFIAKATFTQEMQKFLDECKKGNIVDHEDDLKIIKEWCESDPFAELNRKVESLSNDHQIMIEKLNEMMTLLKEHGLSLASLPGTNVQLVVKNCNSDKEKIISDLLVRLLSPKMSQLDLPDVPEADKEKIIELVREAMSELLSGGRELEEIYHACVNLKIRCSSFENLCGLWTSCINGKLTGAFKRVERYLQKFSRCQELELEIGITHFELNRCLEATVIEVTKTIYSSTKVAVSSDKEQEEPNSYESLITNVQDSSNEEGSFVILNLKPSSFVQAESLWEACRSDTFNAKLRKLAGLLQKSFGCEGLDISARLEEDSLYESVFQYKKTSVGIWNNAKEPISLQDESPNGTIAGNILDETALPSIDPKRPVETRVEDLIRKHQEFQKNLESLGMAINIAVEKKMEIENAGSILKDLEKVICLRNERDVIEALKKEMEILQVQLVEYRTEQEECEGEISCWIKDTRDIIETIRAYLSSVIPDLKLKIKSSQTELVNGYVELTDSGYEDTLGPCCSEVGYVLHELMTSDLNRWAQLEKEKAQVLGDITVDDKYNRIYNYVCLAFKDFIHSTFIVSDQSDYCIRLFKKQLPTITLRLLAGDRIDLRTVEVKVILLPEDHVAFRESVIKSDVNDHFKLKAEKKIFTRLKDEKFVITCGQLEIESEDFEKLKSQHSPSTYFKQLYRFVFFMSIQGNEYATISLPVVVINDASESCCALGGIMWNCFDADVLALPLERKENLPWLKVAEMLKMKFSRISDKNLLSDENLNHLKRRLTGRADFNGDSTIALSKFCYEPLGAGCKFSFWKWVLANYNLVEKYLKHYWEEGLIGGFLSRSDVETIFKVDSGLKSGTFILRFSDNHITDSVGTKSVFGILTAIVVVKMEVQVSSSTRMVSRYEAVEVADHNKLRKTPLANILKDSMDKRHVNNIYRYLYPGMRRREDTFDKYCLTERSLHGYIKQQDAFIIELEQGMFALKNPIRRRNSDSSDSGDSGLSYSPNCARSSSPARDEFSSGIYQQAESLIDLDSATTPVNSFPNYESLFTLQSGGKSGGAMFEEEKLTGQTEPETIAMVNEVTEKLKHWLKESPEFLDRVLQFLLFRVPKDNLVLLSTYK